MKKPAAFYIFRGPRAGCTGHVVQAPHRLYAVYSAAPDTGVERLRATALTGREAQTRARQEARCGWTARIVPLVGAERREAQDIWAETTGRAQAERLCRESREERS